MLIKRIPRAYGGGDSHRHVQELLVLREAESKSSRNHGPPPAAAALSESSKIFTQVSWIDTHGYIGHRGTGTAAGLSFVSRCSGPAPIVPPAGLAAVFGRGQLSRVARSFCFILAPAGEWGSSLRPAVGALEALGSSPLPALETQALSLDRSRCGTVARLRSSLDSPGTRTGV